VKRLLKWTIGIVLALAATGFLAFLYFIPPFLVASPETFSQPVVAAAPGVSSITDPGERAIAERGRAIVVRIGCIGCHATNGSQGPDYTKYLAGGGIRFETLHGTLVSRNLTPDAETGIGRRTDAEIMRVLRSGVFPDGHVTGYTNMPWADLSNLTEEDRHAVVVYLRHLPPLRHVIPNPDPERRLTTVGATERAYGGRDYGTSPVTEGAR
jgi:mono/diheme cytochrome c family protein